MGTHPIIKLIEILKDIVYRQATQDFSGTDWGSEVTSQLSEVEEQLMAMFDRIDVLKPQDDADYIPYRWTTADGQKVLVPSMIHVRYGELVSEVSECAPDEVWDKVFEVAP